MSGKYLWGSSHGKDAEAEMAHRRIRTGNTRGSYLWPDMDYSGGQCVVAGDQVFLVGVTGLTLDSQGFDGRGDPAAQAETAMRNARVLLQEAGAGVEDICMTNVYVTERSYLAEVCRVIERHLEGVNPVSTELVVKSLAESYIDFEIDIWAVIPADRERGHERLLLGGASRAVRANNHVFLQGQTGLALDGSGLTGKGDPAAQAETAMSNVRVLLQEAGARMEDVCKVTTYITDPAVRELVYPVLARHLEGVHPVSTGIVMEGLAMPDLDFAIDVFAMVPEDASDGHERFRLSAPNYLPVLDYPLSKAVRAGRFVFLQGQTGLALDGSGLVGRGDPAAQAETAMSNVRVLLEEAGARMEDICKVTTYVKEHSTRELVYPVMGRHLRGVHQTSTGIVAKALANPELDFEIDVFAAVSD